MAIDNVGGKPNVNANNAASSAKNAAKANAEQLQQTANIRQQASNASARADTVALSTSAQRVAQATSGNSQTQEVDQKKIQEIKKALKDGVYNVDPEKLAAKIIAFEEAFDD
jgi:negative regulator of flagellin synthesis FlgM